ncbi:uncharacterized protein TNCV_3337421 [Trichonephila clavipes]|nr:uncharacterized protein TNCV_3337421 [Trichonephila clavipes]
MGNRLWSRHPIEARSLRAQAQLIQSETKTLTIEKKAEKETEDFIRVVENLDGTVESTDTIVKLKTKIENSSTFESDPDFVKTLIKNCIDERVSRNEREATLEKQKIELAKLQLAQLEKEVELQTAKNKALSLNPAAKVEEKQSGSRKETPIACGYTEDPFKNRPRNYKPKIKDNYPQYLERENKNCFICGDSSHYARDCENCFKPKESNGHIHNRKSANSLKVKSEKQKSDEFAQQLQYVNIFVENQPVTALIDSEKIELREDLKSRRGLAVSLEIICHNCGESTSTMSSKISNKCYDVNLRLKYGMRAIGKGGAAARIFCGLMNLPPPPAKFERHNSLFLNVLKIISEDSMNAAVHEAVMANDNNSNIAVAVDGTWHKRGYSSLNGVVCATSLC